MAQKGSAFCIRIMTFVGPTARPQELELVESQSRLLSASQACQRAQAFLQAGSPTPTLIRQPFSIRISVPHQIATLFIEQGTSNSFDG